jgi:hypothetical protein
MASKSSNDRAKRGRSLPAGKNKADDAQPAQPSSSEQSGSAGRRTDVTGESRGKDTGQGRYGQSGLGGKRGHETQGQASYRRSGPDGGRQSDPRSNPGSGRPDRDSQEPRADSGQPGRPKRR